MKVGIIGAGVAGLSCAHELERLGIRPVLYERNSYVGDQIIHTSALIEIRYRPIKDLIRYMRKKYALSIKPLNTINTFTHYSPNKKTVITGNLGYLINRSKDDDSLFRQILSQLHNTDLRLNETPDPWQLSQEYDYVVIANGTSKYAEAMGCWQSWLNTYVRGAVVEGSFDPHELIVWINKDYCKRGYAYMTPLTDKKASLILIVSDVNEAEINRYWELFLDTECIKYKIIEEYELEHRAGFTYPLKVDNILFAGIAGGAIDPFLGFGQFTSITMGVMAARSIVLKKDYEKLVSHVIKQNLRMLQFRKLYDKLDNAGYDVLISMLGIPGIKHVAYYSPLNVVKLVSTLAKLFPTKIP